MRWRGTLSPGNHRRPPLIVPAGALVRVLQSSSPGPPPPLVGIALGALYDQLGAPAQTEEAARKALQLNPDDAAMHLLLARALIEKAGGGSPTRRWTKFAGCWTVNRITMAPGCCWPCRRTGPGVATVGTGLGFFVVRQRRRNRLTCCSAVWINARLQKQRQGVFASIRQVSGEGLPAGGTLFVFLRQAGSHRAAAGAPSSGRGSPPSGGADGGKLVAGLPGQRRLTWLSVPVTRQHRVPRWIRRRLAPYRTSLQLPQAQPATMSRQ